MRRYLHLVPLLLGLCEVSCGGGDALPNEPFEVVEISVLEGQVWQINRPVRFTFNGDVDFSTVSLNTVHFARVGGAPAVGSFHQDGPRTFVFQPACPLRGDYADAGFLPGGLAYRVDLPAGTSGAYSVRSADGRPLATSQSRSFTTPDSDDPTVLFLDLRPGPPAPVVRTDAETLAACHLVLGEDDAQRVYFRPREVADPALGADVPEGFLAGLDLYSDVASRVAVEVYLDQPIDPSEASVSPQTVRLEYRDAAGGWRAVPREVRLVANCAGTGARVRVRPLGVLPQDRIVRVRLTEDLRDIVGQGNQVPVVVGSFLVGTAFDPGTTVPGDGGDELLEDFELPGGSPGSLEDTTTPLVETRAEWGQDGSLRAAFAFGGTGGPGGEFDWRVGHDPPGPPETVVLDTTFTLITNADQSAQQLVVGGVVDVRDLLIKANGTVRVQGPNPCRILVAGTARIDGTIEVKGSNNLGVVTLGTANIPETGAAGQAGGGRGGTGSYLTTQSTPVGGDGFGPFEVPGGGGRGGETGYNPIAEPEGLRRAGGGGGGVLGHVALRPTGVIPGYTNLANCPDQERIGLDAEPGFRGAPTAGGALHPGQQPLGGEVGPSPFVDGDPSNDFWGTMRRPDGSIVHGELQAPTAGAGGGAGGDSVTAAAFPPPVFDPNSDEKGSGGGGGGGSLTILALGPIVFGPSGRIDASGGTGGGGEDQFPIRRIAGGSGGGSGGHVVLQTASRVDFSECSSAAPSPGGIFVLGGQGGEGANGRGGASFGTPTTPALDALPSESYPSSTAPCRVGTGPAGYQFTNTIGNNDPVNVVVCCGGDGGPGILQLHVPTLADIVPPVTPGESIFRVCKPPPVGSVPPTGVPTLERIDTPAQWDHLLPVFGRKSQAISKWIPLGRASVRADPASDLPDPVRFAFEGTDAAGAIETVPGSGGAVSDLPPILAGTLGPEGLPPYVAADDRTVVFDGATVADDVYLRNPRLLARFPLAMTQGATERYEVAAASYDESSGELRVTVADGGIPLSAFQPGAAVTVRPRFFAVTTEGLPQYLPTSSRIVVEFQATTATATGDPDLGALSAWVKDVRRIDANRFGNPDFAFFRFRVAFDVSVDGTPLSFDTPIPSLDYFRVPFRF